MRYDLFPTSLWHIKNEISQPLVDELYRGAYDFKEKYESAKLSNQGGYQSPPFSWDSFHPDGIKVVNDIIRKAIEVDFKVMQWWYNINGKGDWNMPHTHPGSDFALVLYLTETDNLLVLMNPSSQRRLNTTTGMSPDTKKGDVLIFPSDIQHFVMPNKREEDRVSISMNLELNI